MNHRCCIQLDAPDPGAKLSGLCHDFTQPTGYSSVCGRHVAFEEDWFPYDRQTQNCVRQRQMNQHGLDLSRSSFELFSEDELHARSFHVLGQIDQFLDAGHAQGHVQRLDAAAVEPELT